MVFIQKWCHVTSLIKAYIILILIIAVSCMYRRYLSRCYTYWKYVLKVFKKKNRFLLAGLGKIGIWVEMSIKHCKPTEWNPIYTRVNGKGTYWRMRQGKPLCRQWLLGIQKEGKEIPFFIQHVGSNWEWLHSWKQDLNLGLVEKCCKKYLWWDKLPYTEG